MGIQKKQNSFKESVFTKHYVLFSFFSTFTAFGVTCITTFLKNCEIFFITIDKNGKQIIQPTFVTLIILFVIISIHFFLMLFQTYSKHRQFKRSNDEFNVLSIVDNRIEEIEDRIFTERTGKNINIDDDLIKDVCNQIKKMISELYEIPSRKIFVDVYYDFDGHWKSIKDNRINVEKIMKTNTTAALSLENRSEIFIPDKFKGSEDEEYLFFESKSKNKKYENGSIYCYPLYFTKNSKNYSAVFIVDTKGVQICSYKSKNVINLFSDYTMKNISKIISSEVVLLAK